MIINIPSTAGANIDQWVRQAAAAINQLASENNATIYTWNKGCVTVPTNTTISGAEQIEFQSRFTGNGTLVLTIYDAEGGVNVALNGTELGALSGSAGQEVLYEVPVTNLVEGDDPLNVFKIWSTTSDSAELRKLEVYRNFAREQISDSAIWGNITGSGKPADDATVGADFQTNLTNKPKDTFNLWADPQFELGSGALESLNAAHALVSDPLSKFNGAIQLAGSTANKKSILITVPASAGQTIFTEWYAHKDGSVNSGADVGLTFRWVDGSDEQISQTTDLQDESAMSTGAWTKFSGSSIAPANTASVGLRVENRASHTAGNFFLSMVSFRSATPALWNDVSGAAKPADNATENTGALADLDTVSGTEIDAGAVDTAELAADAVQTDKVLDGAITKIAHVENGSSVVVGTSGTWTDIVSVSFTKDEAGSGILVQGFAYAFQASSTTSGELRILRDAVVIDDQIGFVWSMSNPTQRGIIAVDSPGAGTYTYKIQIKRAVGGDVTVNAGDADLIVQEIKK